MNIDTNWAVLVYSMRYLLWNKTDDDDDDELMI